VKRTLEHLEGVSIEKGTLLLGDPPKNNAVQRWIRDVIGLSQDCESGTTIVDLIMSNIAAISRNIMRVRKDQKLTVDAIAHETDQREELQRKVDFLERRLSFYEAHNESIRFQRGRLNNIIAAEEKLQASPVIEEMCAVCMQPLEGLVHRVETDVGPVTLHEACYQQVNAAGPGATVTPEGTILDASGEAIRRQAVDTSASLAHMAETLPPAAEGEQT
jgi:hypothetical protein